MSVVTGAAVWTSTAVTIEALVEFVAVVGLSLACAAFVLGWIFIVRLTLTALGAACGATLRVLRRDA